MDASRINEPPTGWGPSLRFLSAPLQMVILAGILNALYPVVSAIAEFAVGTISPWST